MKTLILVFANEQQKAENKLDELLSDKYVIKRTKDTAETGTEYFKAHRWSDNLRACKAHDIYVDINIDNDALHYCIIPCLIREIDKDWDWREHIHYFK